MSQQDDERTGIVEGESYATGLRRAVEWGADLIDGYAERSDLEGYPNDAKWARKHSEVLRQHAASLLRSSLQPSQPAHPQMLATLRAAEKRLNDMAEGMASLDREPIDWEASAVYEAYEILKRSAQPSQMDVDALVEEIVRDAADKLGVTHARGILEPILRRHLFSGAPQDVEK